MGYETILALPVIDFSSAELKPGTSVWETLKSQVRKAAEEYGCFEVLLKNISQELREEMNGALEEILALPLEVKKLHVSDKPFQGYIGNKSSSISWLPEAICLENPGYFDKVESFTKIMWPRGNQNFSKTVHLFSKELQELEQMIRRMIVESFGLEKYLDEHINSAYSYIKMSKYEALKSVEKDIGIEVHTDKSMTTVLYQNEIDGLQIQTKDGEWIHVKPQSFIVIIGEVLNAWVNGRLYSPYHRVMMSGNKPRYSAVLFTVPKDYYIIKAVEELVDEEHPVQFKPFTYMEYLKLRVADDGKRFDALLKAYFGA